MNFLDFHDVLWIICDTKCRSGHLVLAVVGPDVVKTRGRKERRRMSEEFTAAAYWEKHLQTTYVNKNLLGSYLKKKITLSSYSYRNLRIHQSFLKIHFKRCGKHTPAPPQTRPLWTPMALTPLPVHLPLWTSHTLPQTRYKFQSGDITWLRPVKCQESPRRWKTTAELNLF